MKMPVKELWTKCLYLLISAIVVAGLILTTEHEKEKRETSAESVKTSVSINGVQEGNSEGTASDCGTNGLSEQEAWKDIRQDIWKMPDCVQESAGENGGEYLIQVIQLPKPFCTTTLSVSEQGMNRSVTITISDVGKEELELLSIRRYAGNKTYLGTPVRVKGSTDPVKSMVLGECKLSSQGVYEQKIKMKLAHFYEIQTFADQEYFYIKLIRPRMLYDRILVIDAGHGGLNTGTYSPGNSIYYEKEINLDVVFRLKGYLDNLVADSHGTTKVYYTRMSDKDVPLAKRVGMANDVQADLFLSVHCNGNYDTSMYGIETLYGAGKKHSKWSVLLAGVFMEHLVEKTGLAYRAVYQRNDLHIIRNSTVPVCLCEIGYLTNYSDRIYLENGDNRQTVAEALYDGVLESLVMMENSEDR